MKRITFEVIARLINVFRFKRGTRTSTLDYRTLYSTPPEDGWNYFDIGMVIFAMNYNLPHLGMGKMILMLG